MDILPDINTRILQIQQFSNAHNWLKVIVPTVKKKRRNTHMYALTRKFDNRSIYSNFKANTKLVARW